MAPVMSREDLDALIADGLISLGAHCVTHPSLPSLSDEEQRQEIGDSRATLEAMMGQPIRRLAYPFGDYDERSMNIARDLGFDYAVSVETGPVRDPATRFRLPRHDIKNWTGAEFAHRLRWTI
jgi:peptidoglycan/xylan/chitin deacetylase (PgdA/CDA1 family)